MFNNSKTTWVVSGLIALALLVSGISLKVALQNTGTQTTPPFGALAGPDIPFDHICVGGLCMYSYKVPIAATSSIPCAIQFPQVGSSTLEYAAIQINGDGLGTQTFDISTSSSAFGSSSITMVKAKSITGGNSNVIWMPTASTTTNFVGMNLLTGDIINDVATSSDWLTFRIATSSGGTFATYWTGFCFAKFDALQ